MMWRCCFHSGTSSRRKSESDFERKPPMPDLAAIVQAGSAHVWLYLPVAIVLGALHALEPGHAKSLMAAYVIAIKGTARQAVTLGVSAAIGHTFVVWILAVAAFAFGQ